MQASPAPGRDGIGSAPMSYLASLDRLYGLQKHGIKPGLGTIREILDRLGRPQDAYPVLHIGGTNGKGSTAAMAAAVLQAAGHRVGLYTSPHLVDFRERIRVDGVAIGEETVAALTETVGRVADGGPEPTFFEFTTAMAFQHFAERRVEVAVIEVGMGGRFDATNVVTPLVSVVTNVALDHQEFLGHDVASIAAEKAGIIKRGVPVVVGRLVPEAGEVLRAAARAAGSPLFAWGQDFATSGDTLTGFDYRGLRRAWPGLTCPLAGAHQLENAACALAALEAASERLDLPDAAVLTGLPQTAWEGRLEVADRKPLLLLDGAHNPAAGEALAAYLTAWRRAHPDGRVVLVLGMMRDKDCRAFLGLLRPLADRLILTEAQIARAAPVGELAACLQGEGPPPELEPLPANAVARARQLASPQDLICVTGSLMLVGDVKAHLRGCGLSPIRG